MTFDKANPIVEHTPDAGGEVATAPLQCSRPDKSSSKAMVVERMKRVGTMPSTVIVFRTLSGRACHAGPYLPTGNIAPESGCVSKNADQ
jgi:hypothetical protein